MAVKNSISSLNKYFDDLNKDIENGIKKASLMDFMPLFNVKGEPYCLDDHYMFESLFDTKMPRRYLLKCCRQVGKSLNNAGAEVLKSGFIKNFRTLLICPRFEQIKRLSTLYVQPMITDSLIKDMLVDSTCDQSILQRTFKNGSVQYYSFAFLDAERIRSIACDQIVYDEIQDLNWAFMPVIEQTMGGSKDWGMYRYAGTPKSLDNTIEKLWSQSSQDVWVVKCPHMGCKQYNIGCAEMDLLNMIGDRGPICAHCGKALPPDDIRNGGYVPKFPDRINSFLGQHVSQPLHPYYFEYSQIDKWLELIKNRNDYPTTKFMNECLGESHDSADRLMTSAVIREMSISERRNTIDYAKSIRNQYQKLAFGIDWGGGGDDSKSYTVLTIGGFRHGSDTVETIYAVRLSKNFDVLQECAQIHMYWEMFKPDYIAHDYTGAGNVRESMLIGLGIPTDKLIPFTYVYSPSKDVITFNEGGEFAGTRRAYSMDKPRSIFVTCTMLKAGKITLPNYTDCKHLTDDLLNLIEERSPTPRGSDMVLIKTVPDESDDFAHALNFMASSLWYTNGAYPEVAEAMKLQITIDQLKACNPTEAMLKDERMWEAHMDDTVDPDIPIFVPKSKR